ncbi:phosphoribosylformylglycinamidine synthase subunit PurQ [Candidatus Poribacteria bacterium]|nr:phosphoribosylformylglycinamidine synthase subunit PurQ [Candidatus Poribacteria bacterium]
MKKVKVIALRTAGTNCDYETAHAFKTAGAEVDLVHINQLIRGEKELSAYYIMAIPGGFSYGDDIAAGKILANELKYRLRKPLENFVADGKLVIGICNGFQVMVKAGLLPGFEGISDVQETTLYSNDSGKFECRWVYMKHQANSNGKCVFTREIKDIIYLPIAHAEGKFTTAGEDILDKLEANGQVVFKYVDAEGNKADYPWNPNGSDRNIAGICDSTGRIFGLMPHPERYLTRYNHPRWTREDLPEEGDGLAIFRNAVNYAREKL